MVSYLVIWCVQFPIMLIPPHKMRWLFVVKVFATTATILGTVIWICTKAGGSGHIWEQKPTVNGARKSWLIMWAVNSCTASWSTVGVNVSDCPSIYPSDISPLNFSYSGSPMSLKLISLSLDSRLHALHGLPSLFSHPGSLVPARLQLGSRHWHSCHLRLCCPLWRIPVGSHLHY